MAHIVMADDGFAFDDAASTGALDEPSDAFVALAGALAARGHRVQVFTNGRATLEHNGVTWGSLEGNLPKEADLFIANRSHRLLRCVRRAQRCAFWLHESGYRLWRWNRLTALGRRRPAIVFLGVYHAATYPRWAPGGSRAIIPLATAPVYRNTAPPLRPPPPFTIFTARSHRSLDWVLDVWRERIRPAAPKAQLYVVTGDLGPGRGAAEVMAKARALKQDGVELRNTADGEVLADELRQSRVFLHCGDESDMFCMPAAQAQAMGVPAVVCDIAGMRERVVDNETGFVVPALDRDAFATAALRLLMDDALWRAQKDAALKYNRTRGWDDVAADFEELRQ